jgi:hypothetical protein
MTVRVTKPEFNIREKLSQLEKPVGKKGSEIMKSETIQDAREVIRAGRKNLIINGACSISQRHESGTYTLDGNDGAGNYPVDRFRSWAIGGGAFTIQRSDDAPPGFNNSLMYTVSTTDTSVASSEYYCVQQRIEGYNTSFLKWGTNDAIPVTLSFYVKSDIPGTYSGSFWNSGQSYSCVFEYEIFEQDVWEYKVVSMPGPTVANWNSVNGVGLGIWWDFGSGGGFVATPGIWQSTGDFRSTNQVPFMSHSGAKFRMTGIQLEPGLVATEFEHRNHGEELALCQRFYEKWTGESTYNWYTAHGYNTNIYVTFPYKVPKRNSFPDGNGGASVEFSTTSASSLFSAYGNTSTSAHLDGAFTSTPANVSSTNNDLSLDITLSAGTYTPYGTAVLVSIEPNQWIAVNAEF